MARHWGVADGKRVVRMNQGAKTMFSKSHPQDQMACAFGALVFAGLSLGAALFPLIAA